MPADTYSLRELSPGPVVGVSGGAPSAGALRELVNGNGAVFLDGFGATATTFHALARQLVRKPRLTPVERFSHPLHRDLQTATKGFVAQDFHAEFSHLPDRVELMAFWCQVPGNPTLVVDGARVYCALPPSVRDFLATARLRFTALHTPELWHAFMGTDRFDDVAERVSGVPGYTCEPGPGGSLVTHFVTPAVSQHRVAGPVVCNNMIPGAYGALWTTLEDGTPLPPGIVDAVRVAAHAHAVTITWKAGDALFLDNTRMMHARQEQPPQRRMYLLQGWSGHDAR